MLMFYLLFFSMYHSLGPRIAAARARKDKHIFLKIHVRVIDNLIN